MGIFSRLAHYAHRLDERWHERRLGIRTAEWHTQYDPAKPEFRGYAPTSYRDWRVIRRHIIADRGASFIDYGAGLGRTAILAARLPFARVIGVEFDADLTRRARANIDQARPHLRAPIEIICADAGAFDVPLDASTLLFVNPFTGSILAAALDRIRQSYKARPRRLQLICSLPHASAFESEIRQIAWLRLDKAICFGDRKCLIFEPKPPK